MFATNKLTGTDLEPTNFRALVLSIHEMRECGLKFREIDAELQLPSTERYSGAQIVWNGARAKQVRATVN